MHYGIWIRIMQTSCVYTTAKTHDYDRKLIRWIKIQFVILFLMIRDEFCKAFYNALA